MLPGPQGTLSAHSGVFLWSWVGAPPPVLTSRGPGSPGQAAQACREGWAAEFRPCSCWPRVGGGRRPASEDKEAAAARPLQCSPGDHPAEQGRVQ